MNAVELASIKIIHCRPHYTLAQTIPAIATYWSPLQLGSRSLDRHAITYEEQHSISVLYSQRVSRWDLNLSRMLTKLTSTRISLCQIQRRQRSMGQQEGPTGW